MLHFAIPTVTIIGCHPDNPYKVAMLKPANNKHRGKPVLCGGRINLPDQEKPWVAALREFNEEMGGKGAKLENMEHWATRTDPYAEPREKRLHEITPGTEVNVAAGTLPVTAYYACPDYIFTAVVRGEIWPRDGEAEECFWYDFNGFGVAETPEKSIFGGQHDLILGVYFLEQNTCLTGEEDLNQLFSNAVQLRTWLRQRILGALAI